MNPQNHPNRNWRTRMHAACAEFLARSTWQATGARLITDGDLQALCRTAYLTGYESGRASTRPPKPAP